MKAHALLHRSSRAKDEDGRILATIVDYAAVHALLKDLITEGAGSSVHSTVRETVNAAFELLAEKEAAKAANPPVDKEEAKRPVDVSHTEIAKALGLDRSAAWRRVKRAMSEGYLQNLENNPRKKARIALGDPMPGHEDVLPKPDDIMDIDEEGSETSAHAQRMGESAEKSSAYPLQTDVQQPPGAAQHATDGAEQCATGRAGVAHEVATDMPLRSQEKSESVAPLHENPGDDSARTHTGNGDDRPECAQCHVADGKVAMFETEDTEDGEVWLHPVCRRFWLEAQRSPWR